MIVLRDDLGREVTLAAPARRVVSLVPSLTETLFALGRGDAVVGATRYCTEPKDLLQRVERVGGTKHPDLTRIVALEPDLVLINSEENRKQDFDALLSAGLTLFVCFPRRVHHTLGVMRRLGLLVGATPVADQLLGELEQVLAECASLVGCTGPRVFCPIWKNPWMSFNGDTYTDDMLSLAGGRNLCRERAERYCTVSLDEIARMEPEVVLLPDEPYVFAPKDLPALQPLADTPALRAGRVHFIDGKALCWYGPRTAPGLRYLRRLLG